MKSILRMLCVVGLMALSAMQSEVMAAAETAKYTIIHYQQNINDDEYTKKATTSKTDTVGKVVTAATNSYTGFNAPTKQTFTLNADTTIYYYYDRKTYSVSFNVDGNVTKETLRYEAVPTYTGSTDKEPDVDSTYTFTGWLSSVDSIVRRTTLPKVTKTVTYTAQYSKAIRQYTVRFMVEGYERDSKLVDYNQIPTFGGSTPEKHQAHIGNPKEQYTFTGWLCDVDGKGYLANALPAVKSDQNYNALFDVELYDTICNSSLPYTWTLEGKQYQLNAAGNPSYKFNNGNCTATMHLEVNEVTYKYDSVASICSGESFYFGGRQLTQSGKYYDTLIAYNSKGCDSIIELNLTVNPTPTMTITGVEYVGQGDHIEQVIVNYDVFVAAQFDYIFNGKSVKGESVNSKHALTLDIKDVQVGRNSISAKAKTATCESATTEFAFDVEPKQLRETIYIVGETDQVIYDTRITVEGNYHNEYYKLEGNKLYFYEVDLDVKNIQTYENQHSSIVTVKAENTAADGYIHYCDRTIDQSIHLPWGDFRIQAEADTSKTEMEVQYSGRGSDEHGFWYEGKVFVQYQTARALFRDTILVATRPEHFPIEFYGKQYGFPENFQPNVAWESKIGEYAPVCIPHSLEAEKSDLPPHPAPHRAAPDNRPVDLVYNIIVRYLPAASQTTLLELGLCKGDTLRYNGHDFTKTGVYFDTLRNEIGADSIIMLIVNEYQTYDFHEYKTLYNDESWVWEGHKNPQTSSDWEISETGLYVDTYKTINGCDSVYTLHVTKVMERTEHICPDDEYDFFGTKLNATGTYEHKLLSTHGCDSTIVLHLNVKETPVTQERIELCHGEFYMLNGTQLTETGIYDDTLKTIDGCDSIKRYVLNFHSTELHETKATICEGGEYVWLHGDRENIVSKQGIYKDTVRNVRGCDSVIYTLRLTLAPQFKQIDTDTICQNEALTFNYMGSYLADNQRKPGEQIIKKEYKNMDGCDSIYEMHVYVRAQELTTDMPIDLCEGETYTINDKVVNSSCEWNDTISGKTCCDSILHYIVTVHPKYTITQTVTLCGSETYQWEGETIAQAGEYTKTYQSEFGCDSVRILIATKTPAYSFTDEATVTKDMLPYIYHEHEFSTSGTHTVPYVTTDGCDSIYTLNLTVLPWRESAEEVLYLCGDETLTINGVTFSEAGHYSQKILRVGESIADSIYHFELIKAPKYTKYDGVTACESEFENGVVYHYYNSDKSQVFDITEKADNIYNITFKSLDCGCDSTIELHFFYLPKKTEKRVINACEGDFYEFRGTKYTTTSSFNDTLKAIDGCDSITYYQLNFAPVPEYFEADTMPANGQYIWKGHKNDTIITRSGLYFDYIPSPTGCGTKYKLQLFEPTTSYKIENTEICLNQVIEWHGQVINETGIYYDTITSMVDGTDSIFILNLTTRPADTVKITQQICEGEKLTLTINGEEKEYTQTGFYSPLDTANCGTQYLIDLTVNLKYIFPTEEAQICNKEVPYVWHDKYYYHTGLYYDSLHTIHGCDSVYSLSLKVWESAITEKTVDLCEGDYTYIGSRKVSLPGVYNDSLFTIHGCDSVVRYRVNVHRNYYDTISYVLCAGESYTWHGQSITAPGTYRDIHKTKLTECDSIYVLHVVQAPTYSFKKVVTIDPDSLPYQWRDNEYWSSGIYKDEHKTAMGCDSIYELELNVIDHISQDSLIYFCDGNTIYINNKPYSAEGKYSQRIRRPGQSGMDSIFRFTLKIAPTYMAYDSIVACDGEFENGGIVYFHKDKASGQSFTITDKKDSVYLFRFETIYGCDSIVELHFGYRPGKIINRIIEICEGDYYQFRGTKYTSTCSFSDTLNTLDGCDSIILYHLNVKESPTYIETDTIDNNSSYVVWRGHKNDTIITKPGLYTDRIIGPNGCDITYKLIVFKREGIANSETVTICENQKPYIWESHNMSFTQSGIYFDSLISKVDGSDSIFVLNLTILPTDTVQEERQICQGDTIDFYGKKLSKSGHYTYMDPAECGTFHILYLTVDSAYSYTKKGYICESELPYLWRGQECWTTGTYTDSYSTVKGCDSIYTLELTVWPTPVTMISKTLCPGDFMDIHGLHITKAGLYDDTLRTIHGCDSIVRYNIQYTTYQQKNDSATINYGESYIWEANKQAYHESGDYEFIVKSKVNSTCDSIVYHLHLVVDNFVRLDICQGDEFQFRGQSHIITENTIFTDTLYDDHGNKTVQKYILNVWPSYHFTEYRSLCGNEYIEWHGQILHQGGVYFDRLKTAHGCDSIYEMRVTVDSIYNQITDTLVTTEDLPFTWRGRRFWTETEVVDTFRTVAGCDSLFTLSLKLCKKFNTPIDTFLMCKGTSVVVSGHEYTQGGLYNLQYASTASANRPDSIYRFFIQEMEGYYAYDSIRVRESEFTNGIVYNYKGLLNITSKKDSVYKIMASTELGCDSIIELHFGVLRAKYETVSMNVCAGSMVWFNNRWNRVDEPAIIEDKLYTSQGGDSIVTIIINIIEMPMTEHEIMLCNNDTFSISRKSGENPLLITKPGIYLDTLTSRDGCDSIIKYIANRAESYFIERYDSIAKDGTYEWHGLIINQPGVYWDSAHTVYGCDSIYKLTLTGIVMPQFTYNVKLCSGDSIILRDDSGKPYPVTQPGVYYEKLWSIESAEQDSLIRYIVNVALNYTVNDTATIERGETYNWFDKVLSVAGDYRHESKTIDGCDSIVNLHLIIDNTYREEQKVVICYEERPYIWRDMRFYESGNYKDSIHMDAVGDSIFYLDLTVQPEIELTLVEAKLCYGDVFYIRNQKIDKAGTYYDTLTSKITGCDSIIQYIVNEYPTFKYEETRVMCTGSTILWRGKTLTHEGIYWDSLQTVHGCDSLFKLTLINTNSFALDTTIVWCWDDLPYRHFNGYYNTYYDVKDFPQGSRTFIDTLVASNGCDSITRTHVILTNKCNRDLDTIYYCHGQQYPNIIGGQAIDHEGVYYFNQWTFDGYSAKLDSVHRAIAIEARTYEFYETYTACQGDMTEVHAGFIPGAYPTGQRTINLNYKTVLGCDSIYTIDLTVNPSYKNFVSDWQMRDIDVNQLTYTDHEGNPVTFTIDGSQYPAGQNNINLVTYTSTGCEESFNLTLTVVPTTYETDSVRICYLNLPYTYQDFDEQSGTMVSKDAYNEGVYVSHYYRPGGNVSTVKTITLYVDSETTLETAQANPACQQTTYDTPKMVIDFTYSGSKPTEYDLVFSRNAISEGFVNVFGGKVTKSNQIEVQWPTIKQTDQYVRPDNYYVDLTLTNGACGTSAQNTMRLPFTVLYPAWITESLFDHTIAILNENFNGGYIFSNYSWYVNGKYIPTNNPYIYDPNGTIIQSGDIYIVELTRLGETYSIPTCGKVYTPNQPATGRPRLINAATGNQHATPIRMKAYGDGTYYIYSHTGQFCGSGEFHQGEQDILLPEVKGCYIIRMQQTDGESNSEKAMIF